MKQEIKDLTNLTSSSQSSSTLKDAVKSVQFDSTPVNGKPR